MIVGPQSSSLAPVTRVLSQSGQLSRYELHLCEARSLSSHRRSSAVSFYYSFLPVYISGRASLDLCVFDLNLFILFSPFPRSLRSIAQTRLEGLKQT